MLDSLIAARTDMASSRCCPRTWPAFGGPRSAEPGGSLLADSCRTSTTLLRLLDAAASAGGGRRSHAGAHRRGRGSRPWRKAWRWAPSPHEPFQASRGLNPARGLPYLAEHGRAPGTSSDPAPGFLLSIPIANYTYRKLYLSQTIPIAKPYTLLTRSESSAAFPASME